LAGGTDLIFLFIFHGLLHINLVLSTSVAFILSFLVSFTLQKFWTFRNYSEDKVVHQLSLYVLNAFIGLNLNGTGMHLLVNKYAVWYMLAQIIVNLVLGVWNFFVYKFIVFNIGKNEINSK
jgi:putative flippase GtrA